MIKNKYYNLEKDLDLERQFIIGGRRRLPGELLLELDKILIKDHFYHIKGITFYYDPRYKSNNQFYYVIKVINEECQQYFAFYSRTVYDCSAVTDQLIKYFM